MLVGAVIGWLLDRWLGISPWGMIVFLLLGFAAGVLNVMRAAGVVPRQDHDSNDATSVLIGAWPIQSTNFRSTISFRSRKIGNAEIAFTNSALFMLIAVVGLTAVPGRRNGRRARLVPAGCNRSAETVLRVRRQQPSAAPPARKG